MSRPMLFATAALLIAAPAFAQDKVTEVDKVFSWAVPTAPGCAVAVSLNGKVVASNGYGLADLEHGVPITPSTVFDAGSVVKQFVAASVLLLVEEGRISLTEDIRKYLPEMPDPGHKVTVDHLLTHTSGIRDWSGLLPLSEGDPDILTIILRQRGLDFAPGEEWSYSNSNYELLKEIIARTSGMSFSDFSRKRLFEPFGMKSTRYLGDLTQIIKDRAIPYAPDGDSWKQDVNAGVSRGRGALFSTPSDLLLWNDALTNSRLGKFVTEKLQEPVVLNNGRKVGYARALFIDSRAGTPLVWHSGGAGGYSSLLARLPEKGLSLAMMCNVDGGAKSAYSSRIFDLFLPATVTANPAAGNAPAANPGSTPMIATDLTNKAGLFFNDRDGQPLRVVVNNNALGIAGYGPLVTLAPDRFRNARPSLQYMSQAEFELHFVSADGLEIRTKEGAVIRYRRAQTYVPTEADLKAFAGRYESSEIGSGIEMVPDKGGLIMRITLNPDKALPVTPVDRDTFMLGMMTVRFVRDTAGKVIGFDYSNPVVRKIRFIRLGGAGR